MKKRIWTFRNGKIYIGIGGDIYTWHIAIYRFDMTFEKKRVKK